MDTRERDIIPQSGHVKEGINPYKWKKGGFLSVDDI